MISEVDLYIHTRMCTCTPEHTQKHNIKTSPKQSYSPDLMSPNFSAAQVFATSFLACSKHCLCQLSSSQRAFIHGFAATLRIPRRLGWPGRSRSGGYTPPFCTLPQNCMSRNTRSGPSASFWPWLWARAPHRGFRRRRRLLAPGSPPPRRPRPSPLQATNEGRGPQGPRPLGTASPLIGAPRQYLPALARGTGRGEWSGGDPSAPALPPPCPRHQAASRATRAAPGRGPRRPDPSLPGLHVAEPRWPSAARCPSAS